MASPPFDSGLSFPFSGVDLAANFGKRKVGPVVANARLLVFRGLDEVLRRDGLVFLHRVGVSAPSGLRFHLSDNALFFGLAAVIASNAGLHSAIYSHRVKSSF